MPWRLWGTRYSPVTWVQIVLLDTVRARNRPAAAKTDQPLEYCLRLCREMDLY